VVVDLVQVVTRDGVRLDGAFRGAAGPPSIAVDAFCLVHGTGGNFYSSSLFDAFTDRLLSLGCGVLRINTRGHDGISTAVTAQGGRRLGAAYEVVEDCRHDLAAWIGWLKQRGCPRIGLLGHSLGAVKCLYAMAQAPQLAATGVIALSPPRLSYSWFCSSPEGSEFLETYQQAERRVQNGQPAALIEVKLPLPFAITAAGYLEKYGPDERYNYLRFAAGVPCSTLITLGAIETENNMAFRGATEELAETAARHSQLRVEIIPDADHFYTAARDELLTRTETWLRSLFRLAEGKW